MGGFILLRVPGNWLGRLLLVAGWLWALDLLLSQYAIYGIVTAPGAVPAAGMASWIAAWLWIPGTALLLSGIPLLFPEGHLPSRRWRPVAGAIVVGVIASVVGHAAVVWPIRESALALDRSFHPSDVPWLAGSLAGIGEAFVFLVAPIAAIAALVSHYRQARGTVRLQMRWFIAAIAITVCGVILDLLVSDVLPGSQGLLSAPGIVLIPVALAVAVLRYHLYEIDRVISRTLGWAIVTALLAGVLVGGIVILQAVLAPFTNENTIAVAASTLVAAALFQPLRRRVQRAVDRRFDRALYDGQRTVDAFAEQLRSDVDLGSLRSSLAATADDAVRPTSAAVWLSPRRREMSRPMTRARLAWTVAGLDLLLYLITSLNPSDGGVAATILYLVGLAIVHGRRRGADHASPGEPDRDPAPRCRHRAGDRHRRSGRTPTSAPSRSRPGRWQRPPGSSATSCSSIRWSSPSSACRSCSRTAGCRRRASVGSCGSRSRGMVAVDPLGPAVRFRRPAADPGMAPSRDAPVLQALYPVLQLLLLRLASSSVWVAQ